MDEEVADCERELRRLGAEHRYVPLLMTCPGIAWVLGYTIAAELGDVARFQYPGPRGSKVAAVCIARKLAEAIWHMLTRNEPFCSGRRPASC